MIFMYKTLAENHITGLKDRADVADNSNSFSTCALIPE